MITYSSNILCCLFSLDLCLLNYSRLWQENIDDIIPLFPAIDLQHFSNVLMTSSLTKSCQQAVGTEVEIISSLKIELIYVK